ncbi:M23 family metallopeptidase [Parasphingopyxis sp. CP4]|uniref:M23 family metallopeptidase n=1 Tax=Parasphingopyxis sp. CP4 TaxID=2724527 RepID=UPI0015A0A6CA|nr:M23 family metallopeptidase [Parasphingopyxis sp. CP4]QLC20990.1 M23 family metallopeptidase [Parasphingopyxis sp. CP4]
MIQNIAIINRGDEPAEVSSIRIDLSSDGVVTSSNWVDLTGAVDGTAEMAGMAANGMGLFLALQLLDQAGLDRFDETTPTLSTDAVLEPGEILLAMSNYIVSSTVPDSVSVTVGYGDRSAAATGRVILQAGEHYAFPLRGVWNMRGLPGQRSHHRRIPSNEFALDFFKLGADGALHEGDDTVADNSFGYGEDVLAAADGEVITVVSDAIQDRVFHTVREDEAREEAMRRIQSARMREIQINFRRAFAGNYVTLRHYLPDGRTEYTTYGHLAADSVTVQVGDRVNQGDVIGAVGDTGDSSVVHLHVQANDGPDPFYSRSLPLRFGNMRETFGGQDAGIFVRRQE